MRLLSSSHHRLITAEDLHNQFPKATLAECRRFVKACPRDAIDKIAEYLEWREKHSLDCSPPNKDESIPEEEDVLLQDDGWCESLRRAMHDAEGSQSSSDCSSETATTPTSSCGTGESAESLEEPVTSEVIEAHPTVYLYQENNRSSSASGSPSLKLTAGPRQCMYIPRKPDGSYVRDIQGGRMCVVFPGLLDVKNYSSQVYADTISLYVENNLDRMDEEIFTLCLDVRPGKGWPNQPALCMLSLIRTVVNTVHNLNPQRLRACIVYPIPRAAFYMWRMIKTFLDPQLREFIVLIPSGGLSGQPSPKQMYKYMDEETLSHCETLRLRLQEE